VALWNLYGPTETTIWSTVQRVQLGKAITIGHPIANTQIYLLDAQQRLVPPGEVGELCIAGDGVALGYLRRPALTAERFGPAPFANQPSGLLYRTGDLGQLLPSGELQCLGRLDQQVKIRGHRIELGEIEHALLGIPHVREAIVTALPGTEAGDERLVAHLVLDPDAPAEPAAGRAGRWQAALAHQLPAAWVPSEFRYLRELPRTLNGKTDRATLAAGSHTTAPMTLATPAPVAAGYVAPRTATEQLLVAIWQECLALSGPVGIHDDFFAVGGHSLAAVRVMVQLEKSTGQRLPLAALLEYPTVSQLAALLEPGSQLPTWRSLVPLKPSGSKPPLYIVHGAGLHVLKFNSLSKYLASDQPVYGLQAKGVDGVEAPLTTIEEMAAHYVADVLAHNPSGPYALAGYSYGGIIAFEMTRQLLAAGHQIIFLGMFDTYAHQPDHHRSPLARRWQQLAFQTKKLAYKSWLLLRRPRLVLRYYNPTLLRRLLARLRYSDTEQAAQYEASHGYSPQVGFVYEAAQAAYHLTPMPVHMHLFRNMEQAYYMEDRRFLGWRAFAAEVTVHDIPGNHFSLFDSPHVQTCAYTVQQALNKAVQASHH
jgi:thioesterase domain-containing protein/acyl carrier protein